MPDFDTLSLPTSATAIAPDGSQVRVLLRLDGASMAHFALPAGQVSRAVTHRTVEELWFVLSGRGRMWRRQHQREATVALEPGVCLTIPAGTSFQFRADPASVLSVVAVTLPHWPGDDEAVPVDGCWPPSP